MAHKTAPDGFWRRHGAVTLGSVALIGAFAFAGFQMGQNASAHGAAQDDLSISVTSLVAKGSLLPDGAGFDTLSRSVTLKQDNEISSKDDLVMKGDLAVLEAPEEPHVVPVSINLEQEPSAPMVLEPEPVVPKVKAVAKPKAQPSPAEKQKVIAARRIKLAEENCLARAIYFEARSETELGQLAVAKVILNRKNDPDFPKSICGVVYQGSGRRNSCQFSFACDGLPDDVNQPAAWANAKRIAKKSIDGDQAVHAIGTATNYHADYVKPKWAKDMRRLIKIGRHIFYSDT